MIRIKCLGAATVELVAVSQIKPFIQSRWSLVTHELGLMSTATFLGEIFGGIVWAHLSDSHGTEREHQNLCVLIRSRKRKGVHGHFFAHVLILLGPPFLFQFHVVLYRSFIVGFCNWRWPERRFRLFY